MQLQTQIPISPESNLIDYSSKLLLLGSCFTENIGGKLDYFQFRNWQNPFGVIFNPISLFNLIHRAFKEESFEKEDIFQQDEVWYSFEAHGSCSSLDAEALVSLLNKRLALLKEAISESSHIIITLGTAWVYRHLDEKRIVANCHKVPQQDFSKELLTVTEIEKTLQKIVALIQNNNPNSSVIFTVSPVRHLKDGFIENSQSKAHLIAAVQGVVNKTSATYFPAYEIVMDELRDYRFYASDLLHPNDMAIDHIWNRFKIAWISAATTGLQQEIQTIQSGLNHRPFHPNTKQHNAFLSKLDLQIQTLKKQLPWATFKAG